MIETKGVHLDNDKSEAKARIGAEWAALAGKMYKCYMVFETKNPDYRGVFLHDNFMEIVKGL